MLSEHNPIAELISQIQKKWIKEVSPHPELKLVRWMIKPEWERLFEGFLKLESTEHGALPEVLVAMMTPCHDETYYAQTLIKDWIEAFQTDEKTQEALQKNDRSNNWDAKPFLVETVPEGQDALFLDMLASFHAALVDPGMRLVVALYPRSFQRAERFNNWLKRILKTDMPYPVTFMVFDHLDQHYFDAVFDKYPDITKSLYINIDLNGAIKKIAKMGNPNDPEVKFRECILEMGEAAQQNDLKQLHQWGERGLQVTQRSGIKSLFAAAHIVYAGMLFSFREYEKIDVLLTDGLRITKLGLVSNDVACKLLLIQFHGYQAASKQMQKKNADAIREYEKQGDLAIAYQLHGMALMPYQQAYTLSKKSLPHRYEELLKKAFAAGSALPLQEQVNSSFPAIGKDYLQWQENKELWEEAKRTEETLKKIFGPQWKEQAKDPAKFSVTQAQQPEPVN